MKHFYSSMVFTVVALALGAFLGIEMHLESGPAWSSALQAAFLISVLSVLEVSLSFDNAVVNAVVLEQMPPIWRRRFLTWGMIIAVFGMRLIFPLAIVSILVQISPWAALLLAIRDPAHYAELMVSTHTAVAAFGGTFLLMVGLKYFLDHEKKVHWIRFIERPLSRLGLIPAVEIGVGLIVLALFYSFLPELKHVTFLVSGLWGLITFITVDGLSSLLKSAEDEEIETSSNTISLVQDSRSQTVAKTAASAGLGLFIYLEVLDASFSFDGVVGAFALTQNLFIIMLGLGVGAMFVRSLTLYLVEKKTLSQFEYLEAGAFYAILCLAVIMFANLIVEIPETVTGLIGAFIIFASGFHSWLKGRRERDLKT
jgi:hypothetical protein